MKLNSNPFSLYDFLGYFLTGFLFVYIINFGFTNNLITSELYSTLKSGFVKDGQSEFDYLFILIVSYVVGHIISFLSSITIEQYNIFIYKYPSRYLLKEEVGKPSFKVFWSKLNLRNIIPGTAVVIILLPLVITDIVFGYILRFRIFFTKPIEKALIPLVEAKLAKIYEIKMLKTVENIEGDHEISEYFLPIFYYIIQNSEITYRRTQNYVALYGYLRNMTLLSLLSSWMLIVFFDFEKPFLSAYLIIMSVFCCYVFFLGYIKFFRRYTKEVIFGALAIEIEED